jgi:hypothetical protein
VSDRADRSPVRQAGAGVHRDAPRDAESERGEDGEQQGPPRDVIYARAKAHLLPRIGASWHT